jgi:hypothetical protein
MFQYIVTFSHARAQTCVCVGGRLYVRVCVCVCVCVCIHVYVCMYVYAHMCTFCSSPSFSSRTSRFSLCSICCTRTLNRCLSVQMARSLLLAYSSITALALSRAIVPDRPLMRAFCCAWNCSLAERALTAVWRVRVALAAAWCV